MKCFPGYGIIFQIWFKSSCFYVSFWYSLRRLLYILQSNRLFISSNISDLPETDCGDGLWRMPLFHDVSTIWVCGEETQCWESPSHLHHLHPWWGHLYWQVRPNSINLLFLRSSCLFMMQIYLGKIWDKYIKIK